MSAFVVVVALCGMQPERTPPPGIDWAPVKAPLDRMATAVEKALGQVGQIKDDIFQAIHWTTLGAAVLLTVIVMHTLHLHGLAASKSNLNSSESRP
jgi:hypothetical protein